MKRLALLMMLACHEAPQPVPQGSKTPNDLPTQTASDGGSAPSPAPIAAAPAAAAPQKIKPAKIKLTVKSTPPKALVSWEKRSWGPRR